MKARVLVGAVALATLTIGCGLCADVAVGLSSTEAKAKAKAVLTAVSYRIDPTVAGSDPSEAPYQFRGGQLSPGRVEDRAGKVILESSEEEGIYGADVSPDQRKVLVHMASKSTNRSVVLEPSRGVSVDLPSKPPGDRMFPFTWKWLGPDLLFGISGVELPQTRNVENCANEQNVERVVFYSFDLKTNQLSELAVPGAMAEPLIAATEVMGDGHVRLKLEAPRDGVEPDLGWFKVEMSR